MSVEKILFTCLCSESEGRNKLKGFMGNVVFIFQKHRNGFSGLDLGNSSLENNLNSRSSFSLILKLSTAPRGF